MTHAENAPISKTVGIENCDEVEGNEDNGCLFQNNIIRIKNLPG